MSPFSKFFRIVEAVSEATIIARVIPGLSQEKDEELIIKMAKRIKVASKIFMSIFIPVSLVFDLLGIRKSVFNE